MRYYELAIFFIALQYQYKMMWKRFIVQSSENEKYDVKEIQPALEA